MNNWELAEKIKTLVGITDEEKAELIRLLRTNKKYGLVWEDKPEDVEEELKTKLPVVTEVKEPIISSSPQAPDHILIEGDNLEALTALSYTHAGRIDVIYIDPPYNTGNKDFVYNDQYVDREDSYRHSKWLSFMDKRLKIARKLLSDKGAIFISIDDNEQAQLKLLCDDIFGEKNFVDIFSWVKTETPANLALKSKKAVEYILCYTKAPNKIKYRGLAKTSESNNGLMNQTNSLHELTFPKNKVDTKLKDGIYKKGVYGTKKYHIELLEDTEVKSGYFVEPVKLMGKFKWDQDYLDNEIKKGTVVSIKTKAFSPSYEKNNYEPEVPWNLINRDFGVGTNDTSGDELSEILGDGRFDYPKPVSLIMYLLGFMPVKYILDFFAGSGTTLHATMQLNAEDGGHRQCILVTNNENGICENVTYERNKRVIEGYTTPKGERVEGLHANNLRYFRTGYVERERTMKNMRELVSAATDMLRIKEGMYSEEPRFGKWERLPQFVARHFVGANGGEMIVVYDEEAIGEIAGAVAAMTPKEKIKVYVFSPDGDPYSDEFIEVEDKVELCALPEAILNAYREVLPPKDDKSLEPAAEYESTENEVETKVAEEDEEL